MKKSIQFSILFDEQNIPEQIDWLANDDMEADVQLKSLFIAGWEEDSKSTATFSIWTKEMRVDEMQQLFIQSLLTMANSFERATGDKKIQQQMQDFVASLGQNSEAK